MTRKKSVITEEAHKPIKCDIIALTACDTI